MPAILDPALALRGATLLVIGLALLVIGEVLIEKHYPKRAPVWTLIMLLPMIVTVFTSVALGSIAGAWVAYSMLPQNFAVLLIGLLIGVFAGAWSIAMLRQVLCNLLRKRLGLKPQKLELWQKQKRKRRAPGEARRS